jgi:hypothetical protein
MCKQFIGTSLNELENGGTDQESLIRMQNPPATVAGQMPYPAPKASPMNCICENQQFSNNVMKCTRGAQILQDSVQIAAVSVLHPFLLRKKGSIANAKIHHIRCMVTPDLCPGNEAAGAANQEAPYPVAAGG